MKFEKPVLHAAKISDACSLSKLAEKTFREAFAKLNKKQDFEKYVGESFTENKIKSEISDRESFFYIAKLEEKWVGYAKLCHGPTPECVRPLPAIELSRLYSLQQYWGCGIGLSLIEKCIEHACNNAFKSIWLSSWKKNTRGNAFYSKMKFEIAGSTTFALGSDIQEDHIFSKLLI
ncbi:MAG: GNAT family N-acetyltransferase [Desulfobacula sp.]|jgi:diamine N-acetyltransferase|uniref:GNAT family N-acetyltransferase n=1 Tax=Desulfobacula sp. TaxID=2593537 RepID=UPI001D8C4C65|nr:GNAT family N-acetyltransferase [Desulfobacula sp.]MBT3484584.1 GNAT family N-acetyltransferase [Desulfobacula sp.]MBT3803954.1 GNAT family N-acetyltransferase [Desulfobacula sp.]MBT4023569.1 GNAT family N-acetyltransferase [Desulfobacula sp.]MBT4197763.1 GNAT family N-acetyltransferase [Desulfobacula sp.]